MSIVGGNWGIGYQPFNDLQTPTRSKTHMCDRTPPQPPRSRERLVCADRHGLIPWHALQPSVPVQRGEMGVVSGIRGQGSPWSA
jgi:hypothetical protein